MKKFLVERMTTSITLSFLLAILCVVTHFFGGTGTEATLTEGLIYVTLVVGLSIFVSNSGVVSFGHATFAMIGAYASAWQTCCSGMREVFMPGLPEFLRQADVNPILALLSASLLAALVAALFGIAIMRLAGAAASISMLSMLFVVKAIYENWDSMTAGQSAIVGLPMYVNLWTALASAMVAIFIAHLYATSGFGLRLRASREDEVAAIAYGVNVWRERLYSFVLSAAVSALGGAMYGHFLGSLTVNMYWLDLTFLTLAMLVVGGMRSLTGAVAGALIVVLMRDLLRRAENGVTVGDSLLQLPQGSQEIALALLLLCILMFRPDGIVGDRDIKIPIKFGTSEDSK
jgi:branched-chain amino acid transport system permease protein